MAANKKSPKKKQGGEEIRATLRHVRMSPRKARLIVDMVRGKQIEPALQALQFSPRKSAEFCQKLLRSAVANAQAKGTVDVDKLWITGGWVDMGRTLMRYMPRAQGRATPIRKRSAHITLVLTEK